MSTIKNVYDWTFNVSINPRDKLMVIYWRGDIQYIWYIRSPFKINKQDHTEKSLHTNQWMNALRELSENPENVTPKTMEILSDGEDVFADMDEHYKSVFGRVETKYRRRNKREK